MFFNYIYFSLKVGTTISKQLQKNCLTSSFIAIIIVGMSYTQYNTICITYIYYIECNGFLEPWNNISASNSSV